MKCLFCHNTIESREHLFFECDWSKRLVLFGCIGMRWWGKAWRHGRGKICNALCVNWLLRQLCITYGSTEIVLNFAIRWILKNKCYSLFVGRLVQELWGKAKESLRIPLKISRFVRIWAFLCVSSFKMSNEAFFFFSWVVVFYLACDFFFFFLVGDHL